MKDLLQDRFVTLRNDRYVLPVKVHAKRWDLGIVHGTSGSGQTAFIEPKEVVALNNRLRIAQGELAAECPHAFEECLAPEVRLWRLWRGLA